VPLEIAAITPHPPIIISDIGAQQCDKVSDTIGAMRALGTEIGRHDVSTLVLISPHHRLYGPAFGVVALPVMRGDFGEFGFPEISSSVSGEPGLAQTIIAQAMKDDLPVLEKQPGPGFSLDHGFLVPYSFLSASGPYKCVELSLAMQPLELHYRFGVALGRAIAAYPHKVVFVASGDLSHALTRDAPAGYEPSGVDFDKLVVEKVSLGHFRELLDIPQQLVEAAGECGLRSIVTLAGLLEGKEFGSHVLAYEGPFGVGYLTAVVRMA